VEVTGKPSPLWSENLNLQILQCEVAHRGPDQLLQKIYFLPNVQGHSRSPVARLLPRSEATAGGVTRVSVECTALFGFFLFHG
jgi:hypothetical protein